jgi:hypothetical protein
VNHKFLRPKGVIRGLGLQRTFLYIDISHHIRRYQARPVGEIVAPGQLMDILEKKSRELESPVAPGLTKLAKMPMHEHERLRGEMAVAPHVFVLVKSQGRC